MIQSSEVMPDGHIEPVVPIRAVVDCPGGGRLVTLGLPGLAIDHRGRGWVDPEALAETLAELGRQDTALLLLLVRDDECPVGYRRLLKQGARRAGIDLIALPIDDYQAPGAPWLRAWRRIEAMVDRQMAAGRSLALCCLYGAGRSGTVAAAIVCWKGLSPPEALGRLRSAFADSVESPVQEAWIQLQTHQKARPSAQDEEL